MGNHFNSKIQNDDSNFETANDLLMDDIVAANVYNKLVNDLLQDLQINKCVYTESQTFWTLTIKSLKDSRMIRLCRIFDNEKNSISFPNMLDAIKEHKHFYSSENFRNRLKDNPFLDSLIKEKRSLNLENINSEIEEIKSNDTVRKITLYRNNFLAHRSLKAGLNNYVILIDNPIDAEEIDSILDFCTQTINKYLTLFKAVSWATKIIGHEDYAALIKFANIGSQKYRLNNSL